jgi:predicted O-linked N-acetylglucosamine transferase (SPINDLY family)
MNTKNPSAPGGPPAIADAVRKALALHQSGNLAGAERGYREILGVEPGQFEALHYLGMLEAQSGRLEESLGHLDQALKVNPDSLEARMSQTNVLKALNRPAEAIASCEAALRVKADFALGHYTRGNLLLELGRLEEALACYERVVELIPENAEVLYNRGLALQLLKRYEEALASYERALAQAPADVEVLTNHGIVLYELKRYEEALASYDQALARKPDFAEALNNRANVLLDLRRPEEALASCDRALALRPDYVGALNNRGSALYQLKRYDEALVSCDRALALEPDLVEALNNRGSVLRELKRPVEALESLERALQINPDFSEAHNNCGLVWRDLRRFEEALTCCDRALQIKPDTAEYLNNRGVALGDLKRYAEAAQSFGRIVEIAPGYDFCRGQLLHSKMLCCDWTNVIELCESVKKDVRAGKKTAEPFGYQGIADSAQDLRACAELFVVEKFPRRAMVRGGATRRDNSKIRIGYLSGEFRDQATSVLMTELFELHDKSRFEIYAFDNGWDDGSEIRARLNQAFHEIIDISVLGDLAAASLIQDKGIDILVNLNGYFGRGRQGVFSYKPSPVQVNYLGFPGTIGADYIDYMIADSTLVPEGAQKFYSEKVVFLPNSYQVNDSKRRIADKKFSRKDLSLPEAGFVFCCFNNNYKITPEVFDVWMRILKQVEGGVLWLLEDNPDAVVNLRKEAEHRGVDPNRVIFAKRMPLADHLARQRMADLFLDTLPCNAHTTASDALWAGLPLLTCMGETFSSRVAASLLNAIHMPELITHSLEEYESLAIALATDPARLKALREKLESNRLTTPLFDSALFTKHIEAAYTMMFERYQAGLPPDHLYVPS